MCIYKYEIVNKVTDKKRPFFDKKRGLFVCRIPASYHWYCEGRLLDEKTGVFNYYLLFSDEKFSSHCRKCRKDDFGRYRLKVSKELKEWFTEYYDIDNGNFDIDYVETINNYDVYEIN